MRRSRDIDQTIRHGVRAGRRCLVVHLDVSGDGPPQAAFTVSRAVGGAVRRNTVRRRLRHLVADRLTGLPAGARVVVRALPPSAAAGSSDLAGDLDSALGTALRRSRSGRS